MLPAKVLSPHGMEDRRAPTESDSPQQGEQHCDEIAPGNRQHDQPNRLDHGKDRNREPFFDSVSHEATGQLGPERDDGLHHKDRACCLVREVHSILVGQVQEHVCTQRSDREVGEHMSYRDAPESASA